MIEEQTITDAQLKGLFNDIVEGYNVSHSEDFGDLYFKHFKII